MGRLILLFVRHGGIIVFLFLEALCMYLAVQYNKNQRDIFVSTANTAVGSVYNQWDKAMWFWNLSSLADSLANENAKLHQDLANYRFRYSGIADSTQRAFNKLRPYKCQSATVINNAITGFSNTITINRGRQHGIAPRMGVMSKWGLVGIVSHATAHYAQIMSILHTETRVSAAIKSNRHFGSLYWDGANPRYCYLEDVPKHAPIARGDTIQTSGYSAIFPPGIIIGTVDTFWVASGSSFYNIKVRLSNSLSNVKHVYVINNLSKEELEELQAAGR